MTPREILQKYGIRAKTSVVEALGAHGGFSGASFWRIRTGGRTLCLRRWPTEHPSEKQLAFIHRVLQHAAGRGIDFVPVPLPTCDGLSYLRRAGHLWELAPWMPGQAYDFSTTPCQDRLQAAMRSLATLHEALASFPQAASPSGLEIRPSPGLQQRAEMLDELAHGGLGVLRRSVRDKTWPGAAEVSRRLFDLFPAAYIRIADRLRGISRAAYPYFPCIRDIWSDHVLFTGREVTGIVDFGAMRYECPLGDIARLLGSIAGDDLTAWQTGLAAYAEVRPLAPHAIESLTMFDATAVLLSGMNWIRWIFPEQRHFEDRQTVLSRLERIAARMDSLARRGPVLSQVAVRLKSPDSIG